MKNNNIKKLKVLKEPKVLKKLKVLKEPKVKAKKGGDMFNDAFNASATVGRVMSWFSLVIGIIFSIVLIIVGVVFLKSKTYDSSINAKITNVSCSGSGKDSSCSVELTYQVNENEFKVNTIMKGVYNVGQFVPIKYDSANPQDMSTTTVSSKLIGGICIGAGLLILLGTCLWFYFVQTNNTIAAVSGVGNMAGMVNNGFDNNVSTE